LVYFARRAIIKRNVAIALSLIALLILPSVTGLIELSGAVILHEGSTLFVILNALRLLTYR
jgi:Zn2+/Cd2+-exporting ATPase